MPASSDGTSTAAGPVFGSEFNAPRRLGVGLGSPPPSVLWTWGAWECFMCSLTRAAGSEGGVQAHACT